MALKCFDPEEHHLLTGSYHCSECGLCTGYIGCPVCDGENNFFKEVFLK